MSAKGVRAVASLEHLESLVMNGQFGDAALSYLSGLPRLRQLERTGSTITGAGLVHLRELVGLEVLGLDYTGVSDQAMETIRQMKGLTKVSPMWVQTQGRQPFIPAD